MADDSPPELAYASAAGRWVLLASILGSGLAFIDPTVVNVALPTIGRDLHTDFAALQWTVTAYALTLASLILLGGSLGDRFGRRRIFVIGVTWFAIASLLAALAPSASLLIAARALQGVGGALLTPGSLAMIQSIFRRRRTGAGRSGPGPGSAASPTALGPFVGGFLVEHAVLALRLPHQRRRSPAIVVLVARRHVPESARPDAHGTGSIFAAPRSAPSAWAACTYALIEAPRAAASSRRGR